MEYDISRWDDLKKVEPKQQAPAEKKPSQAQVQNDAQLDEKLKALKKWGNTTIQSELRYHKNYIIILIRIERRLQLLDRSQINRMTFKSYQELPM
jgi:hypothetical protein